VVRRTLKEEKGYLIGSTSRGKKEYSYEFGTLWGEHKMIIIQRAPEGASEALRAIL
jgi:hypothetical protein